jgi:hypothetical protein
MKKETPKIRWHLSSQELRQIKTLRSKGCGATAISRILHLTRNTVSLAFRRMGLPSKPPIPTQQILKLLRANMDRELVARTLHCSLRAVKRIGREHHIRRKVVQDPFRGKRKEVEAMVRTGLYSGREIADTLKVPYRPILNLAHQPEFYGKGKFIGGSPTPAKPAFSSYYPQVQEKINEHAKRYVGSAFPITDPPKPMQILGPEDAFFLIDYIVRKHFSGEMPDDFVAFAEALTENCLRSVPRKTWNALNLADQNLMRHDLAIELLCAANTVRIQEVGVEAFNAMRIAENATVH